MGCAENSSFINHMKDAGSRVLSGGPVYLFLVCLFFILFITGVISGIYSIFVAGSRYSYGASREIPLAMLIATYTFFVITSTGLCLVSSIGHIFGVLNFMPIAKRAVLLSAITILSGFLVIGLELENPFRLAIYLFVSPNFSSNIWWMGVLYAFELIFLAIEFIFIMIDNHKVSAAAGLFALFFGIAAISNLGGVFAMLQGREYWYGPYLPIFFIASALMMGCAAIIFFTVIAYRIEEKSPDGPMASSLAAIGKLTMIMLAVVIFFTIWKMVTMAVGGMETLWVIDALVKGPFAFNFWILEVGMGMIIPFALLMWSGGRRTGLMFTAAALMIISFFFARLDMVVLGEIVPLYGDLGVKEYSLLNTYSPRWREILVVLGGIGFCGIAFMFGEKIFMDFSSARCTEGMESGGADNEP